MTTETKPTSPARVRLHWEPATPPAGLALPLNAVALGLLASLVLAGGVGLGLAAGAGLPVGGLRDLGQILALNGVVAGPGILAGGPLILALQPRYRRLRDGRGRKGRGGWPTPAAGLLMGAGLVGTGLYFAALAAWGGWPGPAAAADKVQHWTRCRRLARWVPI